MKLLHLKLLQMPLVANATNVNKFISNVNKFLEKNFFMSYVLLVALEPHYGRDQCFNIYTQPT